MDSYTVGRLFLFFFPFLCWGRDIAAPHIQFLTSPSTKWEVRSANNSISVPATVPGQVHLDLMGANVIDDFYYRLNPRLYVWVQNDNWTFTSTFEVAGSLFEETDVLLVFEGLDTLSTVYVNGHEVGKTDNEFRRWTFHIKSLLRKGVNQLEVAFRTTGYLEDWSTVRQSPTEFGYDWSPPMGARTQGIWENVYLAGFSDAAVEHVVVTTRASQGPNPALPLAHGDNRFNVTVKTSVLCGERARRNLDLGSLLQLDVTGSWAANATSSTVVDCTRSQGAMQPVEVQLHLEAANVDLWYPHTHGKQPMYTVKATVSSPGSPPSSSSSFQSSLSQLSSEFPTAARSGVSVVATERNVGFRTAVLITNDLAEGPKQYYKVNGLPIFAKGANYIPTDIFDRRVTAQHLKSVLQSAAAAHMNLLRVWGGGYYNKDIFYDLCDELGIMLHSEGVFSNRVYPDTPSFYSNVAAEIRHQASRLAHHPSIISWAGNNEMSPNTHGFTHLYVDTLFGNLTAVDDTRVIRASCPSRNWASGVGAGNIREFSEPLIKPTEDSGEPFEVHQYFFHMCNTSKDICVVNDSWFQDASFVSEYGFIGAPSFESLSPYLSSSNRSGNSDFNLMSEVMVTHGNTFIKNHQTVGWIVRNFGHFEANCTTRNDTHNFKKALYFSSLLQALAIRAESEHYRRGRDQGMGTMGTLFWTLTSNYPSLDWASVEYQGRWKALHYHTRDFYSPVTVSAYCYPSPGMCLEVRAHASADGSGTSSSRSGSSNSSSSEDVLFKRANNTSHRGRRGAGREERDGGLVNTGVGAQLDVVVIRTTDGKEQSVVAEQVYLHPQAGGGVFFQWATEALLAAASDLSCSTQTCFAKLRLVNAAGQAISPSTFVFLQEWDKIQLPRAKIKLTALQDGVRVESDAVAPYCFVYTTELGNFAENSITLSPGSPVDLRFDSLLDEQQQREGSRPLRNSLDRWKELVASGQVYALTINGESEPAT